MGLHMLLLQAHFFLAVLPIFVSKSVSTQNNFPIAKPNCTDYCGDASIPFPFGTREGCYLSETFLVTCNDTHYHPPKPFLTNSNIEIKNISLEGQLTVLQFIAKACYARNGTIVHSNEPYITFEEFTVNNTANKFTVVGCDTYAFVYGEWINQNYYETGCTSRCFSKENLDDGSCSGVGCCQTSIPKGVSQVNLTLNSYDNFTKSYDDNHSTVWDFNNCSYAFLAEKSAFTFSPNKLSSLMNVEMLPMVVDWAIDGGTCEESQKDMSSYACKSTNSNCNETDNGYRCYCSEGYEGNPYLSDNDGCKDIDECKNSSLNKCEKDRYCQNEEGTFRCVCPKGYHGDGRALSYDRPVEERSLANYFLSALKQSCLFQVLDDNIVCEGNSEELTSVAMLAKMCLHVKGEDRPSMMEVAKELESLRSEGKHSWNQTEPNEEESESLLSGKMKAFAIENGDDSSSKAIGYDSIRDHIILPMGGAKDEPGLPDGALSCVTTRKIWLAVCFLVKAVAGRLSKEEVWRVNVTLKSNENHTNVREFNSCTYVFHSEESEFTFPLSILSSMRNVEKLPMVVDLSIGNGTCRRRDTKKLAKNLASLQSMPAHPHQQSALQGNCA
ncbi:unnamed protein product [Fraxinus pennsylvanica]|uniref:EGF-like domain-containing protein n=1 Tax=Fraxinus pennsylvanica TaxID=56036 RepID=A0AAD2A386_9LAMI|nr:unnamed protein product [Fraxinus pennsylvanica]